MGVNPVRPRPGEGQLADRLKAGIGPAALHDPAFPKASVVEGSRGQHAPERNGVPAFSNAVSLQVQPELVLALRQALAAAPGVRSAFVHGSIVTGEQSATSAIELVVIGDASYADCFGGLLNVERLLKRRIRVNFVSAKEWRRKLLRGSAFPTKMIAQPRIFIFGSGDDWQA